MGADRHEKRRHDRLPPFVPLLTATLDSPAWRALSHGARSLYTALKRRYSPNTHNNGHLFVSQRMAAQELGSHHNEVARWFRELQHYGFIVRTTAGHLGVEGKGKAPHWRLTELGYMRDLATQEFMRWDGRKFREQKTESRAGKGARCVPEMAHTTVPEMAHTPDENRAGNGAHTAVEGVREIQHITSLPLPAAISAPIPISDELVANARRRGGIGERPRSGSAVDGIPEFLRRRR
jgi:hypothetical protein